MKAVRIFPCLLFICLSCAGQTSDSLQIDSMPQAITSQQIIPVNSTVQSNQIQTTVDSNFISDSIPIVRNANAFFYDSLFTFSGHESETQPQLISKRNQEINFILPIALLILLSYFTLLKFQFQKQLSENLTALMNMNLGQQIHRDREFSLRIFSALLQINTFLVFGLYIYLLALYYQWELPFSSTLSNLSICLLAFPFMYLLRTLMYAVLKYFTNYDLAINFFRFNTNLIYQFLSIALIPIVILMTTLKSEPLIWVIGSSFILIIIAYLFRLYKGFSIGASFLKFRFFYFLLYICALEIAPLLIVYKSFVSIIQ